MIWLTLLFGLVLSTDNLRPVTLTIDKHQFTGSTSSGFDVRHFRGYFVGLNDSTGCADPIGIKHLTQDEIDAEDETPSLVTYIDWFNSQPTCNPTYLAANLESLSISRIVLAIKSGEDVVLPGTVDVVTLGQPGEHLPTLVDNISKPNNLKSIICEDKSDAANDTGIPMSSMAILFVTVAFVTLMTVSIGWLVFYYAQRCRQRNMRERLQSRLFVAAKRAVSKLPTKTVPDIPKNNKKTKKTSHPPDNESVCSSCSSDDGDFCPVCLDLYKPKEVIRILPCKHEFHKSCVDPWLFDHRTCPMCKLDILDHLGMPSGGDRLSTPPFVVATPVEFSDTNVSTRVDQEVQTDFVNHHHHHHQSTHHTPSVIDDEIAPHPVLSEAV